MEKSTERTIYGALLTFIGAFLFFFGMYAVFDPSDSMRSFGLMLVPGTTSLLIGLALFPRLDE